MTTRRKLSPEELLEAQALKEIYEEVKREKKLAGQSFSQEDLAVAAGWTQGTVSAYMGGRLPINLDAAITFSILLDRPVSSFSERLQKKIELANNTTQSNQGAVVSKLVRMKRVPVFNDAQITALYGNKGSPKTGEIMLTTQHSVWTTQDVSDDAIGALLSDSSMSPDYRSGDCFIIDPAEPISPSCIVLALDKLDRPYIRYIRILETDQDGNPTNFELYAANDDYPKLSSLTHQITLVGKAVEQTRTLL